MSTYKKMIADKLVQIEENVEKVYNAGKKAEYDAFWDRFQSNRESLNSTMTGIFHGRFWGFDNFYPKYDIKPVGSAGQYLFYAWENLYGDSEGSLKQRLKECGVVLDTSQATSLHAAFAYGRFTELPTIDCSLVNVGTMVFANGSKLHTIDKVIVSETVEFTNWFNNCPALKNITFEGVIGQNIDFRSSTKLSADSIRSIIEHLSDTASGKTLTLSKTAVNNADFSGGDTVYFSTDGEFDPCRLHSNPIAIPKGQTLKVVAEWEEGHVGNEYEEWWFGFAGSSVTGSGMSLPLPFTYTADADKQIALFWDFHTEHGWGNIPIKIRAVLVDENGNEITGENLHSFATNTVTSNAKLTIAEESWETLRASKPNWTISLV